MASGKKITGPKKVPDSAAPAPMEVSAARPLVPVVQQPVADPVTSFFKINDTYYKVLSKDQRKEIKKYISTIKYVLMLQKPSSGDLVLTDDEFECVDRSLLYDLKIEDDWSVIGKDKTSDSVSASFRGDPLDSVAKLPKLCIKLLEMCQTYQGKLFWTSNQRKLNPLINIVISLNDRVQASKGYLAEAVKQTTLSISDLLFDSAKKGTMETFTETSVEDDFTLLSEPTATFADRLAQKESPLSPLFNLGVFQKLAKAKDGNMDKLFEFSEALTKDQTGMDQTQIDKNNKLIMWALVIGCLDVKQTLCEFGLSTHTLATQWLKKNDTISNLRFPVATLKFIINQMGDELKNTTLNSSDDPIIITMLNNSGYVDYTAFLKGNVFENIQAFEDYALSVLQLYDCEVTQNNKDLTDFENQQLLFDAIIAGAKLRSHGITINGGSNKACTESRNAPDGTEVTPLTPFGGDLTKKINSIIGYLTNGIDKDGIKYYSVQGAFYKTEKASRDPQHQIAPGSDYEAAAAEDAKDLNIDTQIDHFVKLDPRYLEVAIINSHYGDSKVHEIHDELLADPDIVEKAIKRVDAAQAKQAVETTQLADALESIFFNEVHEKEASESVAASDTFSEDSKFLDIWTMIPKVGVEVTLDEFIHLFDDRVKDSEKAKVVDKLIEKAYDMCLPIVKALGTAPFKYRLDDKIPNISLLAQDFSFIGICFDLYKQYSDNISQKNQSKISALLYVINTSKLYSQAKKDEDYTVNMEDWRQIYLDLYTIGSPLWNYTFEGATLLDEKMQDVNDFLIHQATVPEASIFSFAINNPLPNIYVQEYVSSKSKLSMFSFSDLVYKVLNLGPFKTMDKKTKANLIHEIWELLQIIDSEKLSLEELKPTFSPEAPCLSCLGTRLSLEDEVYANKKIPKLILEKYQKNIELMKKMLFDYFDDLYKKLHKLHKNLNDYFKSSKTSESVIQESDLKEAIELATLFKKADFGSQDHGLEALIKIFTSIGVPPKDTATSPIPPFPLSKTTQSPIILDNLPVKGINNRGYYCYLISTLQILFRIPIIQQMLSTYADSTPLATLQTKYEAALLSYSTAKKSKEYTQADEESKTVSSALSAAREGARKLGMNPDNNADDITIQSIIDGLTSKPSKATSDDSADDNSQTIKRLTDIRIILKPSDDTPEPTIQSLINYFTPKNKVVEDLNKDINAEFFRNKKPYVIALLKKIYDDFINQKSTSPIDGQNIEKLAAVLFPNNPSEQQDIDDCFGALLSMLEIPNLYDPFYFLIDKTRTQPDKDPETTSASEGSISLNIETFKDDKKNPLVLQNLVNGYFSEQRTSTDEASPKDDKTKITATSSPNILRIAIKRFMNLTNGSTKKLTHNITAPDTLVLPVKDSPSGVNYDLYAFQIHKPSPFALISSTDKGHYISYIKNGQQWYCFNDSSALPAKESTVKSALQQAYVLYYQKEGAPAVMPVVSPIIIPDTSSGGIPSPDTISSTSSSTSSSRESSVERLMPLPNVAETSVFPPTSSASVPPTTSDPVGVNPDSAISTPGVSETTPHKTKLMILIKFNHFAITGKTAATQDEDTARQTILECVKLIKQNPPSEDEAKSRKVQANALSTLIKGFFGIPLNDVTAIHFHILKNFARYVSAEGVSFLLDDTPEEITDFVFNLRACTKDVDASASVNVDAINQYLSLRDHDILQKALYCYRNNIDIMSVFTDEDRKKTNWITAGFYYHWMNVLAPPTDPNDPKTGDANPNHNKKHAVISAIANLQNALNLYYEQLIIPNPSGNKIASFIQLLSTTFDSLSHLNWIVLDSDTTFLKDRTLINYDPPIKGQETYQTQIVYHILKHYPKLSNCLLSNFYSVQFIIPDLKPEELLNVIPQKEIPTLPPEFIAEIIIKAPDDVKNSIISELSEETIDSLISHCHNVVAANYVSNPEQAQAVVNAPEIIRQKLLRTFSKDIQTLVTSMLSQQGSGSEGNKGGK